MSPFDNLIAAIPRPQRGDFVAGATVALLLIPQSLAYAAVAGLPAERGLLAAILPPVVGGLLGSSRYLHTGPTAMTSLLTFGAVSSVAAAGSDAYIGLAIALALMVGVVRMAIGILGWGGIVYFMSETVVIGFASAASLLIIGSQVAPALGTTTQQPNPLLGAAIALASPTAWRPDSIAIGLAAGAIILTARWIHPAIPGALIAVAALAAVSAAVGFGGAVLGAISVPLPLANISLPFESTPGLLIPAFVIAVVGFAEPAAIGRRYATLDREAWDPGREFVGQGAANLAAAVCGAFPVGGSFGRTALARLAGARTRWTFVVTSAAMGIAVVLLPLLSALPVAVLAAIVIAAIALDVDLRAFRFYWHVARLQFGVAAFTFAATIIAAPHIERGILLGVAAAVAAHLWRENRLHARATMEGSTLHLWPQGVLYFGSAHRLEHACVRQLSLHREADALVVHLDGLGRIDVTGAIALGRLLDDSLEAGLTVEIRDVPIQARRIVGRVLSRHSVPATDLHVDS